MLKEKGKRGFKSIWECDWCKKIFEVSNPIATEATRLEYKKFCSKECRNKHWNKNASKRLINWVKENGHPKFKGGIGITTDGYIWIFIKGMHNNQIKLHRYLMEVKLRRKLKSTEIVHHINKNKFDNRIENLKILTRKEHNIEHKFLCKK